MDQALLRAEEVARILNIGRSKAYELMAGGELPVVRIGRSVRVPAKGFQEWLETVTSQTVAHRHGPADDDLSDGAERFLWCVDPEAAALRLETGAPAMNPQAELATDD